MNFTFPVAAVDLHSHTDSAAVVAVGDEPDPTGPDRGVQLPLGL